MAVSISHQYRTRCELIIGVKMKERRENGEMNCWNYCVEEEKTRETDI